MSITSSAEGFVLMLRRMEPDVRHGPFTIPLDLKAQETLRALSENSAAYGRALRDMLFSDARQEVATIFDRCHIAAQAGRRKLRVRLLLPQELQSLRWEMLQDPSSNRPIACEGDLLLSRYLSGDDYRPVRLRPKGELRALIAVAAPANATEYQLAKIAADAEITQVVSALGSMRHSILGAAEGRLATWEHLSDELSEGCDILYLVAHGKLIAADPTLYLVNDDNHVDPYSGAKLAGLVRRLDEHRPRLVILTSCESAGNGYGEVLAALGPLLSQAGVPAVLAMQGAFSATSNQRFAPVFFRELLRDGDIDTAVNVARRAVQEKDFSDWWMPVLYTSLAQGMLWEEEEQTSHISTLSPSADPKLLPGSQPMSDNSPTPNGGTNSSGARTAVLPTIHFANRKEEIRQIIELADPRLKRPIYVSAPAGFGKSALLCEVADRFEKKNYDCAMVKANRHTSIYQLIDALSADLGLQADLSVQPAPIKMTPGELLISRWKKRYEEQIIAKEPLPGLVILVDFDDIPAKSLTDVLTGRFINDCWDNLRDLQDPPHVLLILAGRALETLGLPNNPEPIMLTPFTYKAVKETAQLYLPRHKEIDRAKAAAHVLYLTGGHPRCMAELLKQFGQHGLIADRYFAPEHCNHLWETVVRSAVDDFERELKEKLPNLYQVVEALCIFRYADYDILQAHCDTYCPQDCYDGEQLSDLLTQSYLFTGGTYVSDGIGRQLVTIKLRYEHPDRLRALCTSAADMCLQQIREGTEPSMWALEYLFQRLQAITTTPLERADDRSAALDTYLHREVLLVVRAIHEVRPRWQNFRDLIQLIDEKLGDERSPQYGFWEFIFLFNYLFRADEYDNAPIRALRKALLAERDRYKPTTANKG